MRYSLLVFMFMLIGCEPTRCKPNEELNCMYHNSHDEMDQSKTCVCVPKNG